MDALAAALDARYSMPDIDTYFAALGISTANVDWEFTDTNRAYAKAVLKRVSEGQLLIIADELDIPVNGIAAKLQEPPVLWRGTTKFRLFISHISKDKETANRLKSALVPYSIDGFVAHEDIKPTLEWLDEVERALRTMDAMIAVHTLGFSESVWTQQEIGYALGLGKKVISFAYGEVPKGFDARYQALPRGTHKAEVIAGKIEELLMADERTKKLLIDAQDADIPF